MKEKFFTAVSGTFESDESRSRWLIGVWTVAFGWMLCVTAPLWKHDVYFPQIPSHSIASLLPSDTDHVFFILLLVSLVVLATVNLSGIRYFRFERLSRHRIWLIRSSAAMVIGMICLLVLQNQHRFLPWVAQGVLILGGLVLFSKRDFIRFTQMLCISIYLYSAISKFDNSFVNGIGSRLFELPAGWLGIDHSIMGWLRNLLVLSFPTIELLIGIGLCFEKTRKISVLFGIVMHVSLLLMLGPFGLQNAASVLIWNLFFVVQLPILFHQKNREARVRPENKSFNTTLPVASFIENVDRFLPKQFGVRIIFLLVALFPMASRFNWIDHWSGWELYASSSSYCTLKVSADEIRKLPSPIPYFMTGGEVSVISGDKDARLYVDVFGWSLRELRTPIYPQDRFQLAACVAILDKFQFKTFELILYSEANWWTGIRSSKTFYRRDEANMFLAKYKGHTEVRE